MADDVKKKKISNNDHDLKADKIYTVELLCISEFWYAYTIISITSCVHDALLGNRQGKYERMSAQVLYELSEASK